MPDVVTHNRMGRRVYRKLPEEISSEIDRSIFRVGLLGPDPLAKYRFFAPPLRHGINRHMVFMHNEKTNDFLAELAKYSRTKEMFSYLAGFLCHFALDSTTHPYINRISNYQGSMHAAVERRLDVLELEKIGMKVSDRAITKNFFTPFLPKSMQEDYDTVLKNVYGWDNGWADFRESYYAFKLFYQIIEDPYGIMNKVFALAPSNLHEGRIKVLSYQNDICDGMTFDEFYELMDESVDRAVGLVEAAYAFRKGEMSEEDLRKIIGYKKYNGEE